MEASSDADQKAVDRVRDHADLAEVFRVYGVTLLRDTNKRSWEGLCPFCPTSPDGGPYPGGIRVNAERGFYGCLDCKASGNVIDFVMAQTGLPFSEAVDELEAMLNNGRCQK